MSVMPDSIYGIKVITVTIGHDFCLFYFVGYVNWDMLVIKSIWKSNKPRIVTIFLLEENYVGMWWLTKCQTYYVAIVIKIQWHYCKERQLGFYIELLKQTHRYIEI